MNYVDEWWLKFFMFVLVLAVFCISCTRARRWCIHRTPTLWLVSHVSLRCQMSCYLTPAAPSVMAYLVNTDLLYIYMDRIHGICIKIN
jgi:hypothetical protein